MGSDLPLDNWQLENILRDKQPEVITWSSPEIAVVKRKHSGTLGIKIDVYQSEKSSETFTIVTKVKPECILQDGCTLNVFDRLISINSSDIRQSNKEQIFQLLRLAHGPFINLTHCKPVKVSSDYQEKTNPSLTAPIKVPAKSVCPVQSIGYHGLFDLQKTEFSGKREQQMQNVFSKSYCLDSNTGNIVPNKTNNFQYKRGISQLSGGSDSSVSQIDGHISGELSESDRIYLTDMVKPKEKTSRKFIVKSNSSDIEGDEMEPLRPSDPSSSGSRQESNSKCSMFTVQSTQGEPSDRALSLPTMERDISIQDIHVEDMTRSLPIVSTGPLLSPSSTPCSNLSCGTSCSICSKKVVTSLHRGTSSSRIIPFIIPNPGRSQDDEEERPLLSPEQQAYLVKCPHLARWDPHTKVVNLEKGSSPNFGFKYRVKVGKNTDGSLEIFTIVEEVTHGGPSDGLLNVADWIRSVNGHPIQNAKDPFQLVSGNENSYRLVIQRPVGVSQSSKGGEQKQQLPKKSEKLLQSERLQCSVMESVEPPGTVSPSNSNQQEQPDLMRVTVLPPSHLNICTCVSFDGNVEHPHSDAIKDVGIPNQIRLPKVRIFVCGSEAVAFSHLLIEESRLEGNIQKEGFTCIKCSMTLDLFGSLSLAPWQADLYLTATELDALSSPVMRLDQENMLRENSVCGKCGNLVQALRTQNIIGTVVNVEYFIVQDDSFFHNCCPYLFTKYCIFLLTFDGAKMLRASSEEIVRLQNLSHTIRSFAGEESQILSFGLINNEIVPRETETITADEVKALFYMYTSHGNKLQSYNVPVPDLIRYSSTAQHNKESLKQIQNALWKVITDTLPRQRIMTPSLLILDTLHNLGDQFLTETHLMEIICSKMPQYHQDVCQIIITELLAFGEILSGKSAPISLPHLQDIESVVLLDPKILLDKLSVLLMTSPRMSQSINAKKLFRLGSTGVISAGDLLNLCTNLEPNGPQILNFMECCGLIFRCREPKTGSTEYFIPYFAQESSQDSEILNPEVSNGYILHLQFKHHSSTQLFFHLVFTMASKSEGMSASSIKCLNCCQIQYSGVNFTIIHHKKENRISFLFKREEKSVKLLDVYNSLYRLCERVLVPINMGFVLGPPCPLEDECQKKNGQGSIHIVNLQHCTDRKNECCGDVQLNQRMEVKRWLTDSPPILPKTASSQKTLIETVPWSVFNMVCLKLKVEQTMGNDWRGLAGALGYTAEQVQFYGTVSNPPMELLKDWCCSKLGTVEQLIEVLRGPEMLREDIQTGLKPQKYVTPN
ncbi:hypothetical protein ACJMK2_015810 [Sinanodonta woodiana]|uniref:Uncharacterized protein n=1 Tax=Sinanodonta woodiana TaxID=1069815 RepID=A0ABD3UV85_SINWO